MYSKLWSGINQTDVKKGAEEIFNIKTHETTKLFFEFDVHKFDYFLYISSLILTVT